MSILFIIGLILSAGIGLSLGLIGGGGSILTVPILVYLLGVGPHEAVGMSLAVVGATSILGSVYALAQGQCRYFDRAAVWCCGDHRSSVGSPLTKLVSPQALLLNRIALRHTGCRVCLRFSFWALPRSS
ncbi:MAG: TSUP family transporter [Acidobacteria bacterium]|nr:TSUP family transporter [Acidobacteriota bacterium]